MNGNLRFIQLKPLENGTQNPCQLNRMPELPEVETIVRGLQKTVVSHTITTVTVFRKDAINPENPTTFAQRLSGHTIKSVTRRAKYLIFELDPPLWLMAHLRMTGKFVVTPPLPFPAKHHRLWFHLDPELLLVFADVRCFGTLKLFDSLENAMVLHQLGIEPLSADLTTTYLKKCFTKSTSPIKNLLLNQNKVVGIGNIYAAEILFDSGISPCRPGSALRKGELRKLTRSIQKIIQASIEQSGTSISDFRRVDEQTGVFQNFLKVYGKAEQPCPRCSTPILRIVQQQRSSFYCPSCQQ